MGLGAYLATNTDTDHYKAELIREKKEVEESPELEKQEIYDILCAYVPDSAAVKPFVDALCVNPDQWVQVS